jgi:DNA-binding MarR family transcriptional regulator
MEVLQKRTTIKPAAAPFLDQQSGQLVGYLEVLTQRMAVEKRPVCEPNLDCSREEFRALTVLGSSGPVTMTHLAEALRVPLSTATRTVDRLVEKDLVFRNRSEQDRRTVQVEMSESGKKIQDGFRSQLQSMARSWLASLSRGEREIFLELMDKIAHLAKPEPNGHP